MGRAIKWFTSCGYTVCIPITDSQAYDLIVDINGLQRVQVKTTRGIAPSGNYIVYLQTKGGNKSRNYATPFQTDKLDLLFIAVANGEDYLIPVSDLNNTTAITLCEKYHEFRVTRLDPVAPG